MYSVCVPTSEDPFLTLCSTELKLINIFIMFAIPLASKPIVIRSTGPTAPTVAIIPTTTALVPSLRLLKALRIFVPNSIIGVTSFKKDSPIGARPA